MMASSENAKVEKIKQVIEAHFDEEIRYKEFELEKINERIFQAQSMLDKLRVCIICAYYSNNGRLNLGDYINHPSICRLRCEHLAEAIANYSVVNNKLSAPGDANRNHYGGNGNGHEGAIKLEAESVVDNIRSTESDADGGGGEMRVSAANEGKKNLLQMQYQLQYQQHFSIKVCVGNVSKYLHYDPLSGGASSSSSSAAAKIMKQKNSQQLLIMSKNDEATKASMESSQYDQDLITHKWMVYIRSSNCHKIENYIKKVIFYLHFSYKPHDVVEVKSPPFQLIRKGWGEFPVHIQIHFKDPRNKRIDITHQLKLDWTQTGLQTFGGESSQDVDLIVKPVDLTYPNESKKSAAADKGKSSVKRTAPVASRPIETVQTPATVEPVAAPSSHEEVQHHFQPAVAVLESSNHSYVVQQQPAYVDYGDDQSRVQRVDEQYSVAFYNESQAEEETVRNADEQQHRLSPSNFISTDLSAMVTTSSAQPTSFCAASASPAGNQQVQLDSDYFNEIMRNFSMSDLQNSDSNSNDLVAKETATAAATDSFINEESSSNGQPEFMRTQSFDSQTQTSNDGITQILLSVPEPPQSNLGAPVVGQTPAELGKPQTGFCPIPSPQQPSSSKLDVVMPPQVKPAAQVSLAGLIQSRTASSPTDATASKISSTLRLTINKKLIPNFIKPIVKQQPATPSAALGNVVDKSFVIYKVDSSDVPVVDSSLPPLDRADQNNSTSAPASPQVSKKIKLGSSQLTKIKNGGQHERPSQPGQSTEPVVEPQLALETSVVNEQDHENTQTLTVSTNNREVITTPPANRVNDQDATILIYTIDSLLEKSFQTSEQAFHHHHQQRQQHQIASFTFEALLRTHVHNYQIVSRGEEEEDSLELSEWDGKKNKNEFAFNARSIHEYYSWPYGKRKAIEWMRALHLKRKCVAVFTALAESSFYADASSFREHLGNLGGLDSWAWSTKSVVLWLRSRGYTPLEYRHMRLSEFGSHSELNRELDQIGYVCSLAPITDLIPEHAFAHDTFKLADGPQMDNIIEHEDDQDVIVDDYDGRSVTTKPGPQLVKPDEPLKPQVDLNVSTEEVALEDNILMPTSSEERYIREQLDLLNIKSNLVTIGQASSSANYQCNLVEKFILAATRRFAEDLIRQSCSQVFFSAAQQPMSATGASQAETVSKKSAKSDQVPQPGASGCNDQIPRHKFPMNLFVNDVYSLIVSHGRYDFLTNKHMARPIVGEQQSNDVDDDK